MQSKKMPHAQPTLHSRRAQQFAEAGLKIATDTAGVLERSHSHWRKGEFDSGGHGSAREPMEKMPHRGSVQDRPHCGALGYQPLIAVAVDLSSSSGVENGSSGGHNARGT